MTARSLQREEHDRDRHNAHERRNQSHRNVRHPRLHIVLPNVFEVEITVETGEPSSKRDQKFGQWWVHVHEEAALNVLGREATEAAEQCEISL